MSQSDQHRTLVLETMAALENRHPKISFISDLQAAPGDLVPPVINGFRPDVYGCASDGSPTLIAEAKTDGDIDNAHTRNQALAFISHLEEKEGGLFILSVTGCRADFAKTFMRFILLEIGVVSADIMVFDSLDFWRYVTQDDSFQWRLS